MREWKRWTVEEDEKLLREYKLKGPTKLSKEMTNRTMYAITQRYRTLTQSNKLIKRIHETQIDKCPFCGSSRINKVDTWHGNVVEAYYCVNCLKEFLPNGELIPPLYADAWKGGEKLQLITRKQHKEIKSMDKQELN